MYRMNKQRVLYDDDLSVVFSACVYLFIALLAMTCMNV